MYDISQITSFGQQQLLNPVQTIGYSLINFVISLLFAAVIIALGYVVAWAVHWAVKSALDRAKIDKWLRKNNLDKSIGFASVSGLGASLVKWYIFLIFLIPAVEFISLGGLTSLLVGIVSWLPRVIVAIAVMMFGLILADFVSDCMSKAKGPAVKHMSNLVRILIIVVVAVIALQELHLKLQLAESTFLIVLTGITLALSLAVGIGFGLGLRDEAKVLVKKWVKKL
jgi:hypothetical protein